MFWFNLVSLIQFCQFSFVLMLFDNIYQYSNFRTRHENENRGIRSLRKSNKTTHLIHKLCKLCNFVQKNRPFNIIILSRGLTSKATTIQQLIDSFISSVWHSVEGYHVKMAARVIQFRNVRRAAEVCS